VIDLEGQTHYASTLADLPPLFTRSGRRLGPALEELGFGDLQQALLRQRDVPRLKALWNALVPLWDDRTFYDFVAQSKRSRAVVPPPRGVRPGGLRHRRLGLGLPQHHAGDPARGADRLRRGPAPDRGRRAAGAAGPVAHAPEQIAHWPPAPAGQPARRRHAAGVRGASPDGPAMASSPSPTAWGTSAYEAVL
jgi:lysine 2-monooxygenase